VRLCPGLIALSISVDKLLHLTLGSVIELVPLYKKCEKDTKKNLQGTVIKVSGV
jgi:hypothetical protein